MRTISLRGLLLACLLPLASACSKAPEARACTVPTDCSPGAACREGLCVRVRVEVPSFTLDVTSPTNAPSVTLTGAAPGALKVQVYDGAAALAEEDVTNGAWSSTLTLADGSHSLSARAEGPEGGLSEPSAPVVLVVDRVRPTVVSRSPAPAATGHDLRQPITVTFSEAVLLGSQQGKLTTSGGLDIVVTPAKVDATTVSLTPSGRVTPDTLTVTVPADLRDAAGNLVQLPAGAWTFTAPAWLAVGPAGPLNVSAAKDAEAAFTYTRSELGQPQPGIADGRRRGGLAAGAGSDLWAAFVEADAAGAGTAALVVKRWDGAAWTALASFPSAAAGEAVLAVSGGNPVVAFTEAGSLFVKRWSGTAWQAYEGTPAKRNDAPAAGIALAIEPGGNPVVGWSEPANTTAGSVFVSRWSGTAWGGAEVVTTGASDPTFTPNGYAPGACSLATDGSALVVAVVQPAGVLGTSTELVHVYRKNGAAWELVGAAPLTAFEVNSGNPGNPGTQPQVLLSNGDPIVTWIVNNGCTTCKAVAVVAEFDGGWPETLFPLNRVDGQYAAAPQIALGAGGLVAAWHEGPSTPYRSYAALRAGPSTWNPLAGPNDGLLLASSRAVAPFLVLDGAGVPIVLHAEVAGNGTRQLFVRRYNAASLP